MVKLELELTDIDYEKLVRDYLPLVKDKLEAKGSPLASLASGGMATNLLLRSPAGMKDKLAAELINAAAPKLTAELEKMAAQRGISARVQNLHASTK